MTSAFGPILPASLLVTSILLVLFYGEQVEGLSNYVLPYQPVIPSWTTNGLFPIRTDENSLNGKRFRFIPLQLPDGSIILAVQARKPKQAKEKNTATNNRPDSSGGSANQQSETPIQAPLSSPLSAPKTAPLSSLWTTPSATATAQEPNLQAILASGAYTPTPGFQWEVKLPSTAASLPTAAAAASSLPIRLPSALPADIIAPATAPSVQMELPVKLPSGASSSASAVSPTSNQAKPDAAVQMELPVKLPSGVSSSASVDTSAASPTSNQAKPDAAVQMELPVKLPSGASSSASAVSPTSNQGKPDAIVQMELPVKLPSSAP